MRFVVYLSDGTPAFAGAGLCAQSERSGRHRASRAALRDLLDSLNFDERSRPVYDYIVAVRNAAYAQPESNTSKRRRPRSPSRKLVSRSKRRRRARPRSATTSRPCSSASRTPRRRRTRRRPASPEAIYAADVSIGSDGIAIESIPAGSLCDSRDRAPAELRAATDPDRPAHASRARDALAAGAAAAPDAAAVDGHVPLRAGLAAPGTAAAIRRSIRPRRCNRRRP